MSQNHAVRKMHMQESAKSKRNWLDELPEDILSSIVSNFTVRDAAIVSLVSSRWRDLCASISVLRFDLNTMFGASLNRNNEYDVGIHPCPQLKDRFVQGVNQFLRYYKGSRLVRFRVSLCLDIDSTCDIDHWVTFAISRGVEKLYLNLWCGNSEEDGKKLYTFQSELLSHPNVVKMHELFLGSCILAPGVMNQLSALKSLTLFYTRVGQDGLESILSCCLNLESMTLACCPLPLKLCISGSLHQLKFLSVFDCFELKEIVLSANNLITFNYFGPMIKFSFSRVPKLEKVYFGGIDGKGLQYVFSQLAKDLPLLKNLSVHSKLNWVQCLHEEMAIFNNLKLLRLFCNHNEKLDIERMVIVLRACPLLEKFYLNINCPVHFEKRTHSEFGNKHLKEVHIGGFQCIKSFIEFAKYILGYAAALEKMVIDPVVDFYVGDVLLKSTNKTWGEGERQQVFELLKEHSKSARIIVK